MLNTVIETKTETEATRNILFITIHFKGWYFHYDKLDFWRRYSLQRSMGQNNLT
ncbi:MAG: hypothetical protein ACI84K_001196 [Pseudohongiellaceae bacterium]|jgi:hypothetical protein